MADLKNKKLKQVIDPMIAKAFTHPLRGHIWVTLFERGVVSPTEIAEEVETEVQEVSYHFRKLHRTGQIKLAYTKQRRGFDEHFYEPIAPAVEFDDEQWMALPEALRTSISGQLVKDVVEGLTGALEAGCFDVREQAPEPELAARRRARLDGSDADLRQTLDRFQMIQRRAAERGKESAEARIPVAIAMAAYETAISVSAREPAGPKSCRSTQRLSSRACANMSSSIVSVRRPVKVFCWLGW